MANSSLPQSTLDTFQPISASAVHVLAPKAAKKTVQQEMRRRGVRVSLVKPAEISATQVYLSQHPELYREALERAQRLGLFEKRRRRLSQIMVSEPRIDRGVLLNETHQRKSEQMTTIGYARVS